LTIDHTVAGCQTKHESRKPRQSSCATIFVARLANEAHGRGCGRRHLAPPTYSQCRHWASTLTALGHNDCCAGSAITYHLVAPFLRQAIPSAPSNPCRTPGDGSPLHALAHRLARLILRPLRQVPPARTRNGFQRREEEGYDKGASSKNSILRCAPFHPP
jgi:hypothetical protein